MTTIACDLNGMAADSFIGDGTRTVKILRGHDKLVGFCGNAYHAYAVAEWVIGGERGNCPEHSDEDDKCGCELLVLERGGMYTVDGRTGRHLPTAGGYAAIGSGGPVALGALYTGATVEQAVAAAIAHDPPSKGPVIYEPLRKQPTKKGK